MKTALLVLALACASAYGQDPGMMAAQQAAQQAMQASQMATQQALQDMQMAQQASQQAMQAAIDANQQAAQAGQWNSWNPAMLAAGSVLSLSVGPGNVKPGTKLRINLSGDRYAKVYYTTDGWTPTTSSTLYKGPIKIDTSMDLQAIAVGPDLPHSLLIRADYTVNGAAPKPAQETALTTNGILVAGSPIRLATGSEICSATAHPGDKATILLDEDLKVGDTVAAPKGTPVDAVLTLADPAKNGAAGELAFEVHSLTIHGQTVPITGGETLEGGVAKDAVIRPGMPLTAKVTRETKLNP
jgi:Chitobiase/beta-hexosaminidase C-terminal domain